MPLTSGQSLSFYEILGPLGAGGMGEVYRARDTRLDREVAIKVLPEELADDEERLRRFEREAKTLASLNHPNVAGIHGVDQEGDVCFLALELVPGEDLATRLERGPLPVDEAVDVCRQIAEGLEAAHEAGVVHRDLKPANVRITPEGVVKLLDFGLAKPIRPEATKDGTSTAKPDSFLLTEEGLVLGTPTYMSPEQARGKPVDRRTDIWAFGCVLYECLTGKRAFGGESLTDVLASIIEREPDWSRVPADAGAEVSRLLRRCLAKDARVRLRDAGEARVVLAGQAGEIEPVEKPARSSRTLAGFAAGLGVAGLLWGGAQFLRPETADTGPRSAGNTLQLTIDRPSGAWWSKISPDGRRLLYATDEKLWVRDLAQLEPLPIAEMGGVAQSRKSLWSTDGDAIAFTRAGFLEIVRLGQSRAERRCALPGYINSTAWADNGAFLLEVGGSSRGLFFLPPDAEEPELLDWIDPEELRAEGYFNPSFLPGGDEFLLVVMADDGPWIHIASLASRSTRPLFRGSSRVQYVEPGWLAWVDAGKLLVQAFDPETSTVSGAPHELAGDVYSFATIGTAKFSFSSEGTLLYDPMDRPSEVEWIDRQGLVLGAAAAPSAYSVMRLDRTGRWMAACIITPEDGFQAIWIVDLERGTPQRLTQREGWEGSPAWSPDGKSVAFSAAWGFPPHIYLQQLDDGEAIELVPGSAEDCYVGCWSPDGQSVVYTRHFRDGSDLWIVDVDSLERRPLLETPSIESQPVVSPDGLWIAYTSWEGEHGEVYVASFPDLAGRRRVSLDGGRRARWKGDSSELYYLTSSRAIASVEIAERDGLPDPGVEVIVIQASVDLARFDMTPDAQRFLVLRRNEQQIRPVSHLITRWERLLERQER